MNKKRYLFFTFLMLACGAVNAQDATNQEGNVHGDQVETGYVKDYSTALGIRISNPGGITLKHFLSARDAVEGIFTIRDRGAELTGLYEKHGEAFNEPYLKWFVGIGGDIGVFNSRRSKNRRNHLAAGLDAIIGLEYTLKQIPVCFTVDWKPKYTFGYREGFYVQDGGVSVRYIFGHERHKK